MVTSTIEFDEKLTQLHEWISNHKWLPEKIDPILLRRFLHSMNEDVEKAQQLIEHSHMLRNKSPNIFFNRDPFDEKLKKVLEIADIGIPMPKLTSQNHRIIFNRLIDHDAEKFEFDSVIKTFFMVADSRFCKADEEFPHKVNDGDCPIFDMAGFSYRHLTKLSLATLRCYMKNTQEAFPNRLVSLHLINVSPVLSKVLTVLRPFMKAKVRNMMQFHTPNSTTLFDHFEPECIPCEVFGGKGESLSVLKSKLLKDLEMKREYLSNDKNWKIRDANNNDVTIDLSLTTLEID